MVISTDLCNNIPHCYGSATAQSEWLVKLVCFIDIRSRARTSRPSSAARPHPGHINWPTGRGTTWCPVELMLTARIGRGSPIFWHNYCRLIRHTIELWLGWDLLVPLLFLSPSFSCWKCKEVHINIKRRRSKRSGKWTGPPIDDIH